MARVAVACVLLLFAATTAEAGRAFHPSTDDMAEVPDLPSAMRFEQYQSPTRGVTVYLNKDGGSITGGWDDSARDVSSIAWGRGDVEVPAWSGGARRWKQVVSCVRDRFSEFDVDIVTERPDGGEYVMIMVGGDSSILGYGDGVGGVAPYTGEVLRGAVGFVFSDMFSADVENTCTAILHETGHTLGLDHEYLCEDPMTYLYGCGEKRFQDQWAYCGESEERSCGNGEDTQNSWRHLAAAVGLSGGAPEPEPEPDDDDQPPYLGPTVSIDPTDDEIAGNGWIQIDVRADSARGLRDVELGWASERAQYLFSCAAMDEDLPAQCWQDGDVFHFQIYVGTGLRAMAARATDGDGNQSITEARVLYLTD